MKYLLNKILCLISLFSSLSLYGLTVGSDTTVSRQSFHTFPASDSDNEILEFAFMSEGFACEDSTTTCTFRGVFPVRNTLELNEGILFLSNNLKLDLMNKLSSWGNIVGNNNSIFFPAELETLGLTSLSTTFSMINTNLVFSSDITLKSPLLFQGTCSIKGNYNVLNLTDTGSLIIDSHSTLLVSKVHIDGIWNQNIRCVDDTATLKLENVTWQQKDDFAFSNGSIIFKGKNKFLGNGFIFVYDSTQISMILQRSGLVLEQNITFSYDPVDGSATLLQFSDNTSELILNNAALHAGSGGLQLKTGLLTIKSNSHISSEALEGSLPGSCGITFGNDDVNEDLSIIIFPGTVLNCTQGFLNYRNILATSWVMMNNLSCLRMFTDTCLNLFQDLIISDGEVFFEDNSIICRAIGKNIFGSIVPLSNLLYEAI